MNTYVFSELIPTYLFISIQNHKISPSFCIYYRDRILSKNGLILRMVLKRDVPNCIGSWDGKHIALQSLMNSGTEYYNYKGF